jgi:S1-C subfamily serine protease
MRRFILPFALLLACLGATTAPQADDATLIARSEEAARLAQAAADRGFEAEQLAENAAARAISAAEQARGLPSSRIEHISYDGGDYYGEVRKGMADGLGVLTFDGGTRYEGEFRNDLFEGYGVVYFLDDDEWHGDRYEGQFIADTADGYGVYYYHADGYGEGDRYAGEVDDWSFQRYGVYRYRNRTDWYGTVAAGEFEEGINEGYAVYDYDGDNSLAGDSYAGAVVNDQSEGYGVYTASDGSRIYGLWHDDLPDERQSIYVAAGDAPPSGNVGGYVSTGSGSAGSSSSSGAGSGSVTYGGQSGDGGGATTYYGGEGYAGDSGNQGMVRSAQEMLAALGYGPGAADGVFGPQTERAIFAFQNDMGLPATGQVDPSLLIALRAASTMAARLGRDIALGEDRAPDPNLELMATGTGFQVAAGGGFVTNQHVIEGCTEVRIRDVGTATVLAADSNNDLAYLTVATDAELPVAVFRSQPKVARGETVVAIGFPLHGTLSSQGNVTVGTVSALAGYNDDFRELQFSAPIQPGNSGGPLIDRSGHVVGIVSSELVSEIAEEVPQNVNFAIKAEIVVAFLGAQGVDPLVAPSNNPMEVEEVAAMAEGYTRLVECWADPYGY